MQSLAITAGLLCFFSSLPRACRLLTAMRESAACGDSNASKAAVACSVALVGTLDELREGKDSTSSAAVLNLQALSKEMVNKSPKQLPLDTLLGVDSRGVSGSSEGLDSGATFQYIPMPQASKAAQGGSGHGEDVSESQEAATVLAKKVSIGSSAGDSDVSPQHIVVADPDKVDDVVDADQSGAAASGGADESVVEDSSIPKSQHVANTGPGHDIPPSPVSRSAGPCVEPDNATLFVKTLSVSLPSLLKLNGVETVDAKLQQVSSMFCSLSGKSATIPDAVRSVELQLPLASETRASETSLSVLTADSVYVACYAALAATVYLQKTGYYTEPAATRDLPLSQVGYFLVTRQFIGL